MRLQGSCHCGAVRFTVESPHPYPFNLCYCSICRKTAGGGGFAINLGADHDTLEVEGRANVAVYHPVTSETQRHFCRACGSGLWAWDPRWPELVHPLASAIDTPLPVPPERTHLMVASKAPWVELSLGPHDQTFDEYPDESLADWHERLGLVTPEDPEQGR